MNLLLQWLLYIIYERTHRAVLHSLDYNVNIKKKKGPLSWYRKLTWKSAHAWNLIILCTFIACGITTINMVHLIFYASRLSIYDVMYDITTRSKDTLL